VITTTLIWSLGLASPIAGHQPFISTAFSASAPSPAADESKHDVSLRIDYSALLEHENKTAVEHTVHFVRDDGIKALGEHQNVTIVDDPQAPAILVSLSWVNYEDSIYGVSVETRRPGEAPRLLERFECECINSGLSKAVVERIPAALDQLAEPKGTTSPDPNADDEGKDPQGDPTTDPIIDQPERVPLGPKGKVGIGLLAAGAVGVITGGIVLAQQSRFDEQPEQEIWQGRDFGPPGVGVMVAGGAVAITGAVLLIIDRAQARRARKATQPRTRLVPTTRGLAIAGRF